MGAIIPACAVVTAPRDGRIERVAASGTTVRRGDVVAVLAGPGGSIEITSHCHGVVGGAMAGSAQAVGVGEPVVWVERP